MVVAEMSALFYGGTDPNQTIAFAQMMSGIAAAAAGLGAEGVSIAANTGANAAQNNYLAHADAQRLQQLEQDRARGQCGADCQQEIQALQAKDISSDQTLAACQGAQSAQCDQVRQLVRTAAAGYARSNDACVGPNCGIVFVNSPTGDGTVNYQSGKTQQLALETMSGTTLGNLSGAADGVGSAIGGTAELAWTGITAIWDSSARGQLSANLDALGHVIATPSQWAYVLGELTPSQREQLAQDYENGDGYAASKAIGERNFNILATVLPGTDIAKAAEVLNDGAKIGKAVEDVSKGNVEPVVSAKGSVNGSVFEDVNQTAKVGATNEPTLIADRIAAKTEAQGKAFPNGTVADSHAEIGVIQKAYNAGKTQGTDMSMAVSGKDVCGYCKGDIAAAADAAGLKSLTVQAVDNVTGLPKTYYWQPGMKSIKEKP
jgi:hypothetical protein